jgi:hypothetical protein
LEWEGGSRLRRVWRVDLDAGPASMPAPEDCAQAFTLWLRSADFERQRGEAAERIRQVLRANPFTTLQVVLEPAEATAPAALQHMFQPRVLDALTAACQAEPTYLDRYYALQPGRTNGAKRLVLLLPLAMRSDLDPAWLDEVGSQAAVVWRGDADPGPVEGELEAYEYVHSV